MKKIFVLSAILAIPLLSGCAKSTREVEAEITGRLTKKAIYANGCVLYINSVNIKVKITTLLEKDCESEVGKDLTFKLKYLE